MERSGRVAIVTFDRGAAATEIRIDEQAERRIRFEILVDIAGFPLGPVLGLTNLDAGGIAGVVIIGILVLDIVMLRGRWCGKVPYSKEHEAEPCKHPDNPLIHFYARDYSHGPRTVNQSDI